MRYGSVFLVLCFMLILFCTGCDDFHNAIFDEENNDIPEEKYDADRFFVKEEKEPECYSYTLCYEQTDGEVTQIVDFGAENKNFVIVDDRIYYGSGKIVSIDFTGQDKKTFSDPDIGFEDVLRYDDGWLYCRSVKMVEIYGNPVAADGPHTVHVLSRVKIDFSACEEVDLPEAETEATRASAPAE